MKEIILNTGDIAIVDDSDFEQLNQFKWKCKTNKHTKYAYRTTRTGYKKSRCIWMHKVILGIDNNQMRGDHKDFNGLNNQRENLRVATHQQNNCYKNSAKNSTSKYLGVSWCNRLSLWRASITKNYKQIDLGYYKSEIEAALAYNQMAFFTHGEFANLNQLPIT